MTRKPFFIYKSSAGSGKTYTLSKNYIRLALKSKNNYKKILAVTFTNKAAEEMKSRVLQMIHDIANGEEKDLIIEFSKFYKVSPEEIILRSNNLKSKILHNYSYFSITTIDTFFYSIIQSFTRDLKFRGKFNIEMDLDFVANEVVNNFLTTIKKGSDISRWLTDFSKDKIINGKDFLINNELVKMVKNLFSEEFKSLSNDFPSTDISKWVDELKKEIYLVKKNFEKKIKSQSLKILELLKKDGYDVNDFKFKEKGVFGYLNNLSIGLINSPGKRVLSCIEDNSNWINKTNQKKEEIISLIERSVKSELLILIQFFDDEFLKYNTAIELRNNIYSFGITGILKNQVRKYRDENEVILISDISELLYEVIRDDNIPFVFEKVGNTFKNFLIDEFQDTSHYQWKNFKSLIEESLASGDENIIVGDIKQSIYRWRGSDSDIMENVVSSDIENDLQNITHLNTNWRSGEKIISFNNMIFSSLNRYINQKIISDHIGKIYNKSLVQKTSDKMRNKGYVEIVFDENKEDKINAAKKYTIESIKKIQDNGYNAGDIGIIVRDNKDAKIIAEVLIEESVNNSKYNYNHVSADALEMKTAPIVGFFISIFNYFSNFRDRLALSEIVHFYYIHVLNSDNSDHYSLSNEEKLNLLPTQFKNNLFSISRLPIYDMVEELIRIFKLQKIKNQLPFLQAFTDLILEYKQSKGKEITSFLDWWEKNGNKKLSLSSQNNAIQLITIHKSKGLEFNFVIMPFFNWTLDNDSRGGKEKLIWVNLNSFNKKFDFFYPLKYKSSHPKTLFESSYINERKKAYEDNLNLMYVSFTRPKLGLLINAEKMIREDIKNVSDVLYSSLKDNLKDNSFISGKIINVNNSHFKKVYHLNNYPSYSWRDRIRIRTSSEKGIDFDNINRGKKIHDILYFINNYNDLNKGIEIAESKNIIEKKEKKFYKNFFYNLLHIKNIRKFFSPKDNSFNEVEILSKNGDIYRLDRVVEMGDNLIYVIDYKTGEIRDSYLKQIDNYKKMLSEIYLKEIKGVIIYVDLNQTIEI